MRNGRRCLQAVNKCNRVRITINNATRLVVNKAESAGAKYLGDRKTLCLILLLQPFFEFAVILGHKRQKLFSSLNIFEMITEFVLPLPIRKINVVLSTSYSASAHADDSTSRIFSLDACFFALKIRKLLQETRLFLSNSTTTFHDAFPLCLHFNSQARFP